jgi:hypothetical protein
MFAQCTDGGIQDGNLTTNNKQQHQQQQQTQESDSIFSGGGAGRAIEHLDVRGRAERAIEKQIVSGRARGARARKFRFNGSAWSARANSDLVVCVRSARANLI